MKNFLSTAKRIIDSRVKTGEIFTTENKLLYDVLNFGLVIKFIKN